MIHCFRCSPAKLPSNSKFAQRRNITTKRISILFDTETIDADIPVASTDIINVFSDVIIDSGSIEKCLMIYMRKACKKSK